MLLFLNFFSFHFLPTCREDQVHAITWVWVLGLAFVPARFTDLIGVLCCLSLYFSRKIPTVPFYFLCCVELKCFASQCCSLSLEESGPWRMEGNNRFYFSCCGGKRKNLRWSGLQSHRSGLWGTDQRPWLWRIPKKSPGKGHWSWLCFNQSSHPEESVCWGDSSEQSGFKIAIPARFTAKCQ